MIVDSVNQKKVDPAQYLHKLKVKQLKKENNPLINRTASRIKESLLGQQTKKTPNNNTTSKKQTNNKSRTQSSNYDWEKSRVIPGMYKPVIEKDLLIWEAASRPFKQRNKQTINSITMIGALCGLICLFIGMPYATFVIVAIIVLVYAVSTRPPEPVKYKITTHGIKLEDNTYYWYQLGNFWFEKKYNDTVLHIITSKFPGRISMVLGKISESKIRETLSEALLEHKPEATTYEKVSKWLGKIIPLE